MEVRTRMLLTALLVIVFGFTHRENKEVNEIKSLVHKKMSGTDGKKHSLSSVMGEKGLVVVFSCNTCPFVVGNDNFPGWEKQYNSLYKHAKSAGFSLVLINSNEAKRKGDDSLKEMKKHQQNSAYLMPYLVDKNSVLANAFEAKTTPHVFVLDPNYQIRYQGSIDNSWDSKRIKDLPYLEAAITALKNGEEPSTTSSEPRGCSIKRTK